RSLDCITGAGVEYDPEQGRVVGARDPVRGRGAPKMYAPSPTVQMTVWSGFASLAPRAAPTPQPRPPDEGEPKYVAGVRKLHWLASRSYSLTTIVRSSITSPTQRESHAMSIGASFRNARARDSIAVRRSRPAAATFARRSAT